MPWKNWSSESLGVALAILAAFGFSFKAIFVKFAYAVPQAVPVEAITLLALRMSFALPFFAVIAVHASRAAPSLSRRDWLTLIALGLLGYYGASLLDFIGLSYISAGLERLILFTYPTLTVMIGVLFMGKSLQRREIGALLLSYAGIGLVFFHDLEFSGEARSVIIGSLFIFASSLAYAFYLAGSGSMIQRLGSVRFTALAMLVSVLATELHLLVTQPLSVLLLQPLPIYAYAAAMALFSTVLPVFLQSAAIRRIGASKSVMIGTLGPMLTIVFAWLLLDEPLSLVQLAGAGLVLAGVWLVSRR
ncbi:MAG: DMT family transporter [Candidatus Accumulibacter meliphilus]|jgi:drug/metabolite transporter (DMT)-like permease|uniref:DMT family transporter n=1 Tax=Candidatus Accumulibacter meliphilus TaxID=2211374 RepID=A0A369XJU0_9PROT|nr:MAG: DMT family transporter [Candidatus Accumulibacter meliphilus]